MWAFFSIFPDNYTRNPDEGFANIWIMYRGGCANRAAAEELSSIIIARHVARMAPD